MRTIAKLLRPLELKAQVIWHSSLVRARQSAALIQSGVVSKHGIEARAGLAPGDEPGILAKSLRRCDGDMMVVGHEPHLGRLASKLLAGKGSADLLHIRKGAVICLNRDTEGKWRLEWMITPELAGAE